MRAWVCKKVNGWLYACMLVNVCIWMVSQLGDQLIFICVINTFFGTETTFHCRESLTRDSFLTFVQCFGMCQLYANYSFRRRFDSFIASKQLMTLNFHVQTQHYDFFLHRKYFLFFCLIILMMLFKLRPFIALRNNNKKSVSIRFKTNVNLFDVLYFCFILWLMLMMLCVYEPYVNETIGMTKLYERHSFKHTYEHAYDKILRRIFNVTYLHLLEWWKLLYIFSTRISPLCSSLKFRPCRSLLHIR